MPTPLTDASATPRGESPTSPDIHASAAPSTHPSEPKITGPRKSALTLGGTARLHPRAIDEQRCEGGGNEQADRDCDDDYVPGVAGLFGVSAVYHRGNWNRAWSARLQRADHAMIFVAISATATPAYLLACPGTFGAVGLAVMWAITAVAVAVHMVWMNAPERVVGAAYAAVGAASGLAIPGVWSHAGATPALLLIAGGVLHGIGAISYQRRSPDPLPTVFGYHEVFHAYSCVATACQYAAIAIFLI
jgi:hemolysin III